MKRNSKIKYFFIISIILLIIFLPMNVKAVEDNTKTNQFIYLSDIEYESGKTAWGSIMKDKTSSNTQISLYVDKNLVTFKKGIWAHATSTLIYNLSNYDYDYFSTYYGVCTTSGDKGNGVKFYIYTSVDGKTWDLKTPENPVALKSSNDAQFITIDIKNVKYIKLYANDNGANGNDHSVYADCKLYKEGYSDNVSKTVEEYDALIKEKYNANNQKMNDEIELLALQRDLVKNVGQYQLKSFFEDAEEKGKRVEAENAFNWLFNNLDILRLYTAGGKPDGTYLDSLKVLQDLYTEYENDLKVTEQTVNGTKLSDVYKKMIISLSLTHSRTVSFWINSSASDPVDTNPNISIATNRYAIYKDLLNRNKLHPYFEQLEVEEMRLVMNSMLCDDEIEWLRDYIVESGKNWRSSYQFMSYINVNTALYRSDTYYGENRSQWNSKFKLEGYNIANVKYYPKTFIIMQVGGVCWQISNVGQTMCASYGVPSVAVGQPGHVAYLVYDFDKNNKSTWTIWNNVGGWQTANLNNYTGNRGSYKVRLLNGWGNQTFASNNCGSYMLLSQAALEDYDNYAKAKSKILLADSFVSSGDKLTADKLYREALEIQSINLDALSSLITLHINEKNGLFGDYKEDLNSLAELTASKLKYYPLPMYDLLELINKNIDDTVYKAVIKLLEQRTLTEATKATDSNILQSDVCRTMANYLLGSLNFDIATFAFDGENGATLALSSMFDSAQPYWEYSLDGGATWTDVNTGNSIILSEEKVNSITAENDILVHFIGVSRDEKNLFRIDIQNSVGLPKTLYANDLENKFMDSTDAMEWKYNENDNWTSFKEKKPNLSGDKKVFVRMGATGTYLAGDSQEFTFTKDSEDLKKSYISVEHLSVDSFSSETVRTGNDEKAIYAIDGNINKFWHTSRTSTTDERYMVIKLDKPRYISQMQYLPVKNYDYGVLKNGIISTSLDGKNWNETYTIQDLPKNNDIKTFEFNESVYTEYIKIQCTKSYDYLKNSSADWFLCVTMFNLYEDLTKSVQTATIKYSRNQVTALPVTAKLVDIGEDITILNNDGSDTYTFTENGEFIFEFEDKLGNRGSAKALVDWIVDYSFAFDGEDPYTIILNTKYNGLNWEYSIDGGTNWSRKNELTYTLSREEISSLSAENDLKIRLLSNDNIEDDEIINIDIVAGTNLPTNLYANDWENKIMGATELMEWKFSGEDKWISYKDENPDLVGNKTIEVRVKATGRTLGSASQEFVFTDSEEGDLKQVYIPIEHLSVEGFSTESSDEFASYAIDGRPDTKWHTSHSEDKQRYIIIKLDEPRYISKVQYKPYDNYLWGIMNEGIISTSVDGETWTEEYRISGLTNDYSMKSFVLDTTMYAQYVKIQCTSTHDGNNSNKDGDYFFNVAMINLFEDKTDKFEVNTQFIYDIEEQTDKDVTVRIISTNSEIRITNNGGKDTYTFTENGEFTFEFVDEYGNPGSATAKVDWINKDNNEDEEIAITSSEYEVTENYVLKIEAGTKISEFKNNIEANKDIVIKDKKGNIVNDTDKITTGMKLKVGDTIELTLVVKGDIDGDGIISINDFAKLKLHLIDKEKLQNENLMAADLDNDNKISINDFATLKLILIGK